MKAKLNGLSVGLDAKHIDAAREILADKVGSAMHEAEEMLEKASDEIKFQTKEINHTVHKYVRKNPYKALGYAALAGAALALLIRR